MNSEEDLLVWRICLEYNLIYKKCMWDKLAVQDWGGNGWSQINARWGWQWLEPNPANFVPAKVSTFHWSMFHQWGGLVLCSKIKCFVCSSAYSIFTAELNVQTGTLCAGWNLGLGLETEHRNEPSKPGLMLRSQWSAQSWLWTNGESRALWVYRTLPNFTFWVGH